MVCCEVQITFVKAFLRRGYTTYFNFFKVSGLYSEIRKICFQKNIDYTLLLLHIRNLIIPKFCLDFFRAFRFLA